MLELDPYTRHSLCPTHSKLLDVVDNELATGGLHNPPAVGGGVVGRALADGDTLSHSVKVSNLIPWCVEICVQSTYAEPSVENRDENLQTIDATTRLRRPRAYSPHAASPSIIQHDGST